MERGGSFNRVPRHANSVPAEDIPTESHGGPDINIARTGGAPTRTRTGGGTVREQDQFMPIANVIRIMRRILPPHAKISDDAKETVQDCVSEYISFVTGEANDRCQREQRKTITAEDVIWAMGKLGFDDYVEPLTVFLNRFREIESDRTSLRGEPLVKRTVEYAVVPPASPVPPLPQARVPPYAAPFYHSQVAHQPPPGFFSGNYFPGSGSSSGRGPGGGAATSASSSGSQAALFNINDPYAQFK